MEIASLVRAAGATGQDRVGSRPEGGGHLLVLCDGAGGTSGGAEAAELVVASFLDPQRRFSGTSTRAALVDALRWMDRSPSLAASAGLTTAVVAVVVDGAVEGASVGDSEAWLISDDDYIVLTQNQARRPMIGSRKCHPVAFGPVTMKGTLLLGSDGLFKYCHLDRLLSIVRSRELEAIPGLLLDAVRLASGTVQDDFSVLVCREAA